MRNVLTALALSSLFAAAPALAAKHVAKPASTAPVAKAEGDAPKADEKAPVEKKKKVKKPKTTKTEEKAPEAAPAK